MFDPRTFIVGLVDKEGLGRGLLAVLQFSPIIVIPPVLCTHSYIYH
jgi:hypothetical protein